MISILLILKGAALLLKTHAAHAALIKGGAYMLSTHGIAATATAATTVLAGAGVCACVDSTLRHTTAGFSKLRTGIEDNSPSQILEALLELKRAYSSVDDLLEGFSSFIDQTEADTICNQALKDGAKELKSLMQSEIEDSSVSLVAELEDFFKSRNTSVSKYGENIEKIYFSYFGERNHSDYAQILGEAGKVYDNITKYNLSLGLRKNYKEYDHFLAYCIAGWIKDNVNNNTVSNKSQKEIAGDVTDNIFRYIRYNNIG